jgi:transcriptional regulator with XRE-family HTH domain
METTTKPKHIGRNISRIREMREMKQEALAMSIGVSQQTISNIEGSETIDDERLYDIAKALGVTPQAISNFSEDAVFNFFNNFYDNSSSQGNSFNQGMFATFNPLDKVVTLFEEKEKLYERLLQAEKDKVSYLEKLLNDK